MFTNKSENISISVIMYSFGIKNHIFYWQSLLLPPFIALMVLCLGKACEGLSQGKQGNNRRGVHEPVTASSITPEEQTLCCQDAQQTSYCRNDGENVSSYYEKPEVQELQQKLKKTETNIPKVSSFYGTSETGTVSYYNKRE